MKYYALVLTIGLLGLVGCQPDPEPEGEIIDPMTCMRVGSAYEDPIISNLIELGYDMQYESPFWYKDGVNIGYSAYEDEAFVACGTPDVINPLWIEAMHIRDAGGYADRVVK